MLCDENLALKILQEGNTVILPTDTVYGLAADGTSDLAVAKIYKEKGRPSFNPLIMHIHDLESVKNNITVCEVSYKLMETFWFQKSAPLSIVVPVLENHNFSKLALAGLDTVAIRRPNHPIFLKILQGFGKALAAPSANVSNTISSTTADMANLGFSNQIPVVDGGPAKVGIESTIVRVVENNIVILRYGAVTAEDLQFFGKVIDGTKQHLLAPGMLKRHYAPKSKLLLNVTEKQQHNNMLLLGFGKILDADLNLSPSADLLEAASHLFEFLDRLDKKSPKVIGVSPIPMHGLGIAINDRLQRAASQE